MSEPARKPEIDTVEFERRLRQPAPRAVEDPLAELARLVAAPLEPRRPQPIDALSHDSRAALTRDEQDFLNELSLSVDRARAGEAAAAPPEAEDAALARAETAIRRVAAEARDAAAAAPQESAPAARAEPTTPAPVAPHPEPAPATVEFPALKLRTALRGGLDMQGLEAMTRLEDISRDAPPRAPEAAPALPKVDLSAPVFPRPHAEPTIRLAPAPEPDFDTPPRPPRDLDAPLPGDDGFETAAPPPAATTPPARPRRAMAALVAVLGVGVAAAGVAMTMKRGPRPASGEPPTIMASADPVKVAPPAAPAAPADQADSLLARKPAGAKPDAGAKAVGRAEEPVDLAREAQKIVRTVPVAGAQDPSIPRTPTGDSAQPDRLGSVFPEPKRVRTVSIRPDGTVIGADAPPPPPIPAAAASAAAPPAFPAPKPVAPRAETPATTPAATEAPTSRALAEDKPAAPRPRAATPAAQTPAATPAPRRVEKPAPAPKPAAQAEKPIQARPLPPRRPAPVQEAEEAEAAPTQTAAAPRQPAGETDTRAPSDSLPNPFAALFGRKEQPAAAPVTTASTNAADEEDAPAKPARASVGSGAFAVQLSSSPNESDARAAASRLGGRFSGQLGGRAARVVKGEAGGKTVYRVRAGGMSKEGAVSACESIKSSGGSCFVAHD